MAQVAVDANVIIAARLQRDQNHDRGAAILQGIDSGTLPTGYVLDDVLEEIINYIHARSGQDAATEVCHQPQRVPPAAPRLEQSPRSSR